MRGGELITRRTSDDSLINTQSISFLRERAAEGDWSEVGTILQRLIRLSGETAAPMLLHPRFPVQRRPRLLRIAGHTQAEIAKLLGVSQQAVSKWLTPQKGNNTTRSNVSTDCRIKISKAARPIIFEQVESGHSAEQVARDL